jgi:hypothetical protein
MEKAESPLRTPPHFRHFGRGITFLSATNGLCVQQLVLWLIPLFSILSLVFGACRKSLRVYNWDRVCVDLLRPSFPEPSIDPSWSLVA